MELIYPRFIHAELMTYRVFARNASSSRAIPVARLIQDAMENPAMPIHWGSNQPGMQAGAELTGAGLVIAKEAWLKARDNAVEVARHMAANGVTKQIVNRILEPFTHIKVVLTGTNFANFFAQRCHVDAQPEIHHLAYMMWEEMQNSKPRWLNSDNWHLPYIEDRDYEECGLSRYDTLNTNPTGVMNLIKTSTARCARVSYRLHDGRPTTLAEDVKLCDRLIGAHPMHASPAEHQATPDSLIAAHVGPYGEWRTERWGHPSLHGPFEGWIQHRKLLLPGENITEYQGVK